MDYGTISMAQHTIAQFLEACGLRGPMQLNMSHRHGQCAGLRSIELPFVVIGRDPKADLVLSHRDISRRHAYLQVIDQRVFCVDLRSRTGVSWAQGSQQSGWVDDRSGIMIGPAQLEALLIPRRPRSLILSRPTRLHACPSRR